MGRPQIFDEEQVIDKALDVFWEKGFNGASTRDIIDATGISNGSFFNKFGDKKRLYLKCLQKYDAVYMTRLVNILTADTPFKEKIKKALSESSRKHSTKETYEGCFFFNTSIDNGIDDAEIVSLANLIRNRVENAFANAVDIAKKNGEIPKKMESRPLAQYLYNIQNGLLTLLLNNPPASTIDNIINSTLDLLPA